MQAQETGSISDSDFRHGLNPATHLEINNNRPNLIHQLRYNLGILVASHVTCILYTIRYASELVFDPLQGAKEDSMFD